MRIIKSMWLGLLFLPMLANATVTQVTLWQPEPGKTMQMLQVATEAKAMHSKLGAQADMAIDAMGRLHFIMAFEDWETWGAYRAKMAASAEMQAFVAKIQTDPPARQVENFLLNQPLEAVPNQVYSVLVFEPMPGRFGELMQAAMKASEIHTKDGATVGINVDQVGNMHYVMSFESWAAWGAFRDNRSAEWTAFNAAYLSDPSGKLVTNYLARRLP